MSPAQGRSSIRPPFAWRDVFPAVLLATLLALLPGGLPEEGAHAAPISPHNATDDGTARDGGGPSKIVAIDVGHSLARSGAVSARGLVEFEFNRRLAQALASALQRQHVRVVLIGERGDIDGLTERTAAAAAAGAGLLLSIHHDSVQPQYLQSWQVDGRERRYSDRFSGYSLLISRRNPEPEQSLACAQRIGASMRAAGWQPSLHHAEPIEGESRPLADPANGIYWFDNLAVLRTASSPAVLLEAGIIVNRADEQKLDDPQQQQRMAAPVAEGVRDCLAALSRATNTP